VLVDVSLLDIANPNVGLILVNEWAIGMPGQQEAAVERLAAAWEHASWPQALLSTRFLASTDGEAVLTYSQWTNDEGYDIFVRSNANCEADQRVIPTKAAVEPVAKRRFSSDNWNRAFIFRPLAVW
jgi:hypothetical protein